MPPPSRDFIESLERAPSFGELKRAIFEEAKVKSNWANASFLFEAFLCPMIAHVQSDAKLHKSMDRNEQTSIQHALACLVRYAPSPAEANVVYFYFLRECEAPLRDDTTIDHCLISLIYQYAQVKNNPEMMSNGLDLVKVALDRGLGSDTFQQSQKSKFEMKQEQLNNWRPRRENILVSVSRPILRAQRLKISKDGFSLEADTRPQGKNTQGQGNINQGRRPAFTKPSSSSSGQLGTARNPTAAPPNSVLNTSTADAAASSESKEVKSDNGVPTPTLAPVTVANSRNTKATEKKRSVQLKAQNGSPSLSIVQVNPTSTARAPHQDLLDQTHPSNSTSGDQEQKAKKKKNKNKSKNKLESQGSPSASSLATQAPPQSNSPAPRSKPNASSAGRPAFQVEPLSTMDATRQSTARNRGASNPNGLREIKFVRASTNTMLQTYDPDAPDGKQTTSPLPNASTSATSGSVEAAAGSDVKPRVRDGRRSRVNKSVGESVEEVSQELASMALKD